LLIVVFQQGNILLHMYLH